MIEQDQRMKLPKITLGDLFNESEEVVVKLRINEIDDFPNHPYKVRDDERMNELVDSVKRHGVTEPVLVRRKENGRYEMISGHRRKRASELAGLKEINGIIKKLSDEEATILMVDSNDSQRDDILPSEKAFAYKMKMEAMKKQAGRPKNNLCPVVTDLNTADSIGKDNEDSGRQVFRYIRLTELIPEILTFVDIGKVGFRPAVELSYLSKDSQYALLDIIRLNEVTPTLSQAIHLKKLEQEGKLEISKLEEIMDQEKPNQIEKLKFNASRFTNLIPKNIITNKQKEDFIVMCVEEHNKRLKNKEIII